MIFDLVQPVSFHIVGGIVQQTSMATQISFFLGIGENTLLVGGFYVFLLSIGSVLFF